MKTMTPQANFARVSDLLVAALLLVPSFAVAAATAVVGL
jgi:hypothetical protein